MASPYAPRRPIGITLVAILQILIGAFFVLIALGVLGLMPLIGDATVTFVISAIFLILALLSFVTAAAMLSGRKWVWWLAVIVTSLELLLSGINLALNWMASIGDMVNRGIVFIIAVLILAYLFSGKVKAFFRV